MLIEERELTLADVDLGVLDEFSAMVLFGNAYAHRITLDTGISLSEIRDAEGNGLYPGFFMTHLKVPPFRRLGEHQLWDSVAVGVDMRAFGGIVLDSTYVLGKPGEIAEDPEDWPLDELPCMRAGSVFVVEGSRELEPRPAVPRPGAVAPMPKLHKPPEGMAAFNAVQRGESSAPSLGATMGSAEPIEVPLAFQRDLVPGHAVMFATFSRLMESSERELLTRRVWPPFSVELLNHSTLLERETFYLANCHDPGVLQAEVAATVTGCSPSFHGDTDDLASAGIIETTTTMYEKTTRKLLVVSRARKLLIVPTYRKTLLREVTRMIDAHGKSQPDRVAPA